MLTGALMVRPPSDTVTGTRIADTGEPFVHTESTYATEALSNTMYAHPKNPVVPFGTPVSRMLASYSKFRSLIPAGAAVVIATLRFAPRE